MEDIYELKLPDNVDLRSYMLGYLQGCEDCRYKYQELSRLEFKIMLSELPNDNR